MMFEIILIVLLILLIFSILEDELINILAIILIIPIVAVGAIYYFLILPPFEWIKKNFSPEERKYKRWKREFYADRKRKERN